MDLICKTEGGSSELHCSSEEQPAVPPPSWQSQTHFEGTGSLPQHPVRIFCGDVGGTMVQVATRQGPTTDRSCHQIFGIHQLGAGRIASNIKQDAL